MMLHSRSGVLNQARPTAPPCTRVRRTPIHTFAAPPNGSSSKQEAAPTESPRSVQEESTAPQGGPSSQSTDEGAAKPRARRQADSTDPVSTFLTRRFGIAGGLAWVAVLAVGSLGEQVKTRIEVAQEEQGTVEVQDVPEVTLPDGVKYKELKRGGGSTPQKGYLAVIHYTGKANGEVFEDTRERGKPIVYVFTGGFAGGGSRPYTGGLCAGVEEAIADMRAGGRRIIKVPPSMGFGEAGTTLKPTNHVPWKDGVIPPNAELEYDLELLRVSIPPS